MQDFISKVQLIREQLLEAQSRQNLYVDNHYGDLEFMVGAFAPLIVSKERGDEV